MLAEEHYAHDSSIYIEQHMKLIQSVIQAVKSGRITRERLDEASGRILFLKIKLLPNLPRWESFISFFPLPWWERIKVRGMLLLFPSNLNFKPSKLVSIRAFTLILTSPVRTVT
jgi:hypothetical protein